MGEVLSKHFGRPDHPINFISWKVRRRRSETPDGGRDAYPEIV